MLILHYNPFLSNIIIFNKFISDLNQSSGIIAFLQKLSPRFRQRISSTRPAPRGYSPEQTKVRVEGFVEIPGQKR